MHLLLLHCVFNYTCDINAPSGVTLKSDQESVYSQPECLHRQRLLLALPSHLKDLLGSLPQPPFCRLLLTLLLLALAGLQNSPTVKRCRKLSNPTRYVKQLQRILLAFSPVSGPLWAGSGTARPSGPRVGARWPLWIVAPPVAASALWGRWAPPSAASDGSCRPGDPAPGPGRCVSAARQGRSGRTAAHTQKQPSEKQ